MKMNLLQEIRSHNADKELVRTLCIVVRAQVATRSNQNRFGNKGLVGQVLLSHSDVEYFANPYRSKRPDSATVHDLANLITTRPAFIELVQELTWTYGVSADYDPATFCIILTALPEE